MNRLLLVVIALAILGVGILLGSNGRRVMESAQGLVGAAPAATATPRPATPVLAASGQAAPTAAPKPTATSQPVQAAAPRDFVIELAEADLNHGLEAMLVGQPLGTTPLGDATIRSISVALRDGQMYINGGAQIGALSAPFATAGQITPDSAGRPHVTLTGAQVAGFVMPPPVVTGLSNVLQQQIDQVFSQQTMRVSSVEIADGRIRIVASP